MTRTERLLRLARQRGDRAAELILSAPRRERIRVSWKGEDITQTWTEAELREAWGR